MIETRIGNQVSILDENWNYHGERALIIKIPGREKDNASIYGVDGKRKGMYVNEDSDLFLVPVKEEPELSSFEQAVIDYKYGGHDSSLFDPGYFDKARNEAAELLSLARKELCNQIVDHTKEAYENGKAEALKEMPKWKKIDRGNNYSSEVKFAINGRYLEMNDTLNDVYEIKLLDLEKLPKEDEK